MIEREMMRREDTRILLTESTNYMQTCYQKSIANIIFIAPD